MSLGVSIDALRGARERGCAIVAAVAYDLVGLEAIVAAGERTAQPIIAQVGASAFRHVDRDALIAAAHTLAVAASTPIGLHLDHARDLEELKVCLDAGYSSVMVDGSRLDFSANVGLTRQAVEIARPYGAWIEAELGHIEGDEDRSNNARTAAMTDPAEAAMFVDETSVDALAVCVGNVHGRTSRPVLLDLARLREIADATPVPLVLHGASGLGVEAVTGAVGLGVAKLNINADLRAAYLASVATHLAADPAGDDLTAALHAARRSLTESLTAMVSRYSAN